MARSWYAYDGSGDPFTASSYFRSSVRPGCVTGSTLCAIYSVTGDINPAPPLSANLTTYIANALTGLIPQPTAPGVKKYVYLKD